MNARQQIRGYALITVLVIAGLFIALTAAMGTEVVSNLGATKSRVGQSQARYAAYSGLQHALYLLKNNTGEVSDLVTVQMPNDENLSYTVEIIDNRANESEFVAQDGTMVPAGAVHCISMGMHSNKQQVTLHAMGGTLSHPRPQVNHAAFSDQSLEFSGSSRTASYDSGSAEFSIDADGRAVLDADDIEAEGDVGSNRYLSFMDSSEANGEITQPSEFKNASMLQSPYVDLADVLSLDRPVDVVRVPAPPKPPELEVQQALTDTLQVTVNTLAQSMNAVTFIKGFTSNQTVNSTFSKGEYFFPDGLNIQGTITLSQDVDNDNPVVIYSGGDVVLGPSAKVNLNRPAKQLQLYFVKDDESDVQRLKMSGNSQLFATAVGSQLEAELEDDAQLYGGIMARTVKASGNARLFFDEALTDDSLDTEGAWRFSGITEPKPETVMVQGGVLQLAAVRVKDGTVTYAQPVLPKANTMIMIDPGTMTAVQ